MVYDDTNTDVDVAKLMDSLESRGHELVKAPVRSSPELFGPGGRIYDNLIIIPGKTKGLGKTLTAHTLLDFLKSKGNVMALTTPKYSPLSIREAGAQLGIHIAQKGIIAVDNFGGNISAPHPEIVGTINGKIPAEQSPAYLDGELAIPVVALPETSYSYNALDEEQREYSSSPFVAGSSGVGAAAMQTRENARFGWIGSPSLWQNNVGEELSKWVFQEKGVLRISDVEHTNSAAETHQHYKINEPVRYCLSVEEWDGAWKPHKARDIQLEFVMLDPYYRLNLKEISPGRYCRHFNMPDQYGMFTFAVNYLRTGFSFITDRRVVTVRHTANNEWPRSWEITNSWVYVTGAFTVVIAWLIFVCMYLWM